jgi:hypothetical protein
MFDSKKIFAKIIIFQVKTSFEQGRIDVLHCQIRLHNIMPNP